MHRSRSNDRLPAVVKQARNTTNRKHMWIFCGRLNRRDLTFTFEVLKQKLVEVLMYIAAKTQRSATSLASLLQAIRRGTISPRPEYVNNLTEVTSAQA
jgi:hypothetical protein